MVGADQSTELWRYPHFTTIKLFMFVSCECLFHAKSSFTSPAEGYKLY